MSCFRDVFVATDSEEIEDSVKKFGGKIIKTSSLHKCGTDRVAEAAGILDIDGKDIVVNIQADEPLISSLSIENLILSLRKSETIDMATLAYQSSNIEEFKNSNVVKVVVDNKNFALYFSRSQIPHYHDGIKNNFTFLKHLCV
jgi:3-deoxy-manno-octulosonate cytidylyltransferase (CMP-KDO synthetase)